jgi:hypothetical protein
MKTPCVILLLVVITAAYCDDFSLDDYVRCDGYYVFTTQLDEDTYLYLGLNFLKSGLCDLYITKDSDPELQIDWEWLRATELLNGMDGTDSGYRIGLHCSYVFNEAPDDDAITPEEFIFIGDVSVQHPEHTFVISIASISEDKSSMDVLWYGVEEIITFEYRPHTVIKN